MECERFKLRNIDLEKYKKTAQTNKNTFHSYYLRGMLFDSRLLFTLTQKNIPDTTLYFNLSIVLTK